MCNCGSTGLKYNFSVKGCGKKVDDLTKLRNQMATLYNITSDPELKEEYKDFRTEIDNVLKTYYETKSCPESSIINILKQQVEDEYSKYYNQ